MSLSLTMIPGMMIWVGAGGIGRYEFGSFVHFCVPGGGGGEGLRFVPSFLRCGVDWRSFRVRTVS